MKKTAKTALITGGTRGIGLGIAQVLAEAGINLAINGVRDESLVTDVITWLKEKNVDVIYCRGDISKKNSRKIIIDKIKNHYGKLDILVNNAGVAPKKRMDILQATEESFEYIIKTNLQGPYFLTQAVSNWMIEQKKNKPGYDGTIITISSVSASYASINRGDYCISKAGLSMMTKLFAVRLSEFGIPVYEIRPGIIETDMTAGVKDKYDKLIAEGLTLQKRWGSTEDVGKAVLGIISGLFPYSTGQTINVDGGMTVNRL